MLKVLINSYTCCPNMGSEQGMGWNWIVSLAKYCEVFVISEGEYREIIENSLIPPLSRREGAKNECGLTNEQINNLHFYWNPVDQSTRDKCWNQGNWSFYPLYAKWQKKTADIAREICKEHEIDILHQLNMIGFREPGYLHKVSIELNIPLVWGPTDAKGGFPMDYTDGASFKIKTFLRVKNAINWLQLKYMKRAHDVARQCCYVISASSNSQKSFKKYFHIDSPLINETGCNLNEELKIQNSKLSDRFKNDTLNVMWVGKFDFRKRLDIAIETVKKVNTDVTKIKLSIYGTGNEQQVHSMKTLANGCKYIEFEGNRPHEEIQKMMQTHDVMLFTSVAEGTPHVVLEAIANGLPVLCHDCCGHGDSIINYDGTHNGCGIKIPLTNPKQSVKDFADVLTDLYEHREKLKAMSANCPARAEELSWDNKARQVVELYKRVTASPSALSRREGTACARTGLSINFNKNIE